MESYLKFLAVFFTGVVIGMNLIGCTSDVIILDPGPGESDPGCYRLCMDNDLGDWMQCRTRCAPEIPDAGLPDTIPSECCRRCVMGRPCGNTCISHEHDCRQPVGCACWSDGTPQTEFAR